MGRGHRACRYEDPAQRRTAHPRGDRAVARWRRSAPARPTRRMASAGRKLAGTHPPRSGWLPDRRDGHQASRSSVRPLSLSERSRGKNVGKRPSERLRRHPSPTKKPRICGGFSVMDLIGVLSNHDLQGSLGRVVKKLAAVRASDGPRRAVVACRQRPRRPGWVLKAVHVLADRGEPMRAKDIHAAVERSLGEAVAWSSVKMALASNVSGSSPRFVRIARGRYVAGSGRVQLASRSWAAVSSSF